MHSLIQLLPMRRLLLEQLPALLVSFIIAEVFYKFHSFTLECLAFLATWYAVEVVIRFVARRLPRAAADAPPAR